MTNDSPLTLSELFLGIAVTWDASQRTVDKKSEVYDLVERVTPTRLKDLLAPQQRLNTEGSVGAGYQTRAPWVRIYDPVVAPSAQDGPYIAYLFSIGMEWVYLSLALGVTKFHDAFPEPKFQRELTKAVSDYRGRMGAAALEGLATDRLELNAPRGSIHARYELSSIASIAYSISNLPSEAALTADLRRFVTLYLKMINNPAMPKLDDIIEGAASAPADQQIVAVEFTPSARVNTPRPIRERRDKASQPRAEHARIGRIGELLVIEAEKKRLSEAGKTSLVAQIVHVACAVGCDCGHPRTERFEPGEEFPGYDILSFNDDETERYIEVKSSLSTKSAYFLTANEWRAAGRHRSQYWLYLVNGVFNKSAQIRRVQDPFGFAEAGNLTLEVDRYVAYL
ncbi:MAG: DUF3578 domain-containing protein [Dehalococcoidia bacterium]|nr:DUF3578 domain-containing protein [Dehalococcoidia bacterium]